MSKPEFSHNSEYRGLICVAARAAEGKTKLSKKIASDLDGDVFMIDEYYLLNHTPQELITMLFNELKKNKFSTIIIDNLELLKYEGNFIERRRFFEEYLVRQLSRLSYENKCAIVYSYQMSRTEEKKDLNGKFKFADIVYYIERGENHKNDVHIIKGRYEKDNNHKNLIQYLDMSE